MRPEVPVERQSLAACIDALQAPTESEHESNLTRRLAEVLSKPVKRASATLAWRSLSPEEPVAATEIVATTAANTSTPEHRDVGAGTRGIGRGHVRRETDAEPAVTGAANEFTPPNDDGSAEPDEPALPPQASAWVETARRQHARAILASAASWTVSISVSFAIIAVAGWILLGRPTGIEALWEAARGMLDRG
ncbi:MAG: hypothetical protein AB1749_06175 [Pseudomonadota bacterium]